MAESLVSEWLDENRYRAFPLKEDVQRVDGAFALDDGVILDAYFRLTTDTPIELLSIKAAVGTVDFVTTNETFQVELPVPDEGVTVTTASGSKLTFGVATNDIPIGEYFFTDVFFEDGVCIYYSPEWNGVSSLKFGGVAPQTGSIGLFPRIQTYLSAKSIDELIWMVNRNQGTPPDNCVVYGDLPDDCGSQVSYINGVAAGTASKQFKLTAGNGLVVTNDPDNNQLLVSLLFDVGNICPPIPPTT